jgi:hypothetical protein
MLQPVPTSQLLRVRFWVVAVTFGALTIACVAALLMWNVVPLAFPIGAHALLGSLPLAMIAIALLIYQVARRPPRRELLRALIAAAAFACWAANQLLSDIPQALLLNDMAIALFVLDVFLLIVSAPPVWPAEDMLIARFAQGPTAPQAPTDGVAEQHSSDTERHEA